MSRVKKNTRCSAGPVKPRGGWVLFVLGIVMAMFVLLAETYIASSMLWRATELKLSETAIGGAPVPAGARERSLILPVAGIDGKWWVIHTEQMIREGSLRVRHTSQDNSPHGRDVHWSSGLMWFLAAGAWAIHAFTGKPVLDCVPMAAMYSGPVLLLILLSIYAAVLKWRFGCAAAGIGVLFFVTCSPVFELFRAGNCDHHGIVGWLATMSLLCLAAAGGGCVAPRDPKRPMASGDGGGAGGPFPDVQRAHRWMVASGVAGGAGLWVSAATQIPVLVGTAAGALVVGWIFRRSGNPMPAPELWRTWGRAGCITSLLFYFLEYFPGHMGWRLEVNHPLYALAWLGGSEMLARLVSGFCGRQVVSQGWRDRAWGLANLVFLLLPAAVIVWRQADVFWVSDHFLLALHNEHIGEFQPFFQAIEGNAVGVILFQSLGIPLFCVLAAILLGLRSGVPRGWIPPLVVVFLPSVIMLALGMRQIRWLGISLCLWSLLAVLLSTSILLRLREFRRWQLGLLALGFVSTVGLMPLLTARGLQKVLARPTSIPKDLLPNVIARDVVQRILRANPARMPVILSGPTTSTDLAFYGGTRMMGTLYWENMPGLKAAADIFSAPDSESAKKKLLERGVTHILLFSWDEFSKDYSELWGRDAPVHPGGEQIFATRLLEGAEMPQWVRPLFYPIPPAFGLEGESVSLFEIVPDQSRADSLAAQATYRMDAGQYDSAISLLRTARSEFPQVHRFSALLGAAENAAAAAKQASPSGSGTTIPPAHQ